MLRTWIFALILVVLAMQAPSVAQDAALPPGVSADQTWGFLTPATGKLIGEGILDAKTEWVQGRFGVCLDEKWQAGLLGTYYTRQVEKCWGLGGWVKYIINPDAEVPIKGFLPGVGEWLNLPDSIPATSYFFGTAQGLPYARGVDLDSTVGVGAMTGPVRVEFGYKFVESGDNELPSITSDPVLTFGMGFYF